MSASGNPRMLVIIRTGSGSAKAAMKSARPMPSRVAGDAHHVVEQFVDDRLDAGRGTVAAPALSKKRSTSAR